MENTIPLFEIRIPLICKQYFCHKIYQAISIVMRQLTDKIPILFDWLYDQNMRTCC